MAQVAQTAPLCIILPNYVSRARKGEHFLRRVWRLFRGDTMPPIPCNICLRIRHIFSTPHPHYQVAAVRGFIIQNFEDDIGCIVDYVANNVDRWLFSEGYSEPANAKRDLEIGQNAYVNSAQLARRRRSGNLSVGQDDVADALPISC
jgi:hypothetical protein